MSNPVVVKSGTGGPVDPKMIAAMLPTPVISSISPNFGATTGGTNVTISGSGFTGQTAAVIGGAQCTNFVVVNDTTITCTTGAVQAQATADVRVGTGKLAAAFNYLTSFDPATITWTERWRSDTTVTGSPSVTAWAGLVSSTSLSHGSDTSPTLQTNAANSLPEILFDGVANRLSGGAFNLGSNATVVIIGRQPATSSGGRVCDGQTVNTIVVQQQGVGEIGLDAGGSTIGCMNSSMDLGVNALMVCSFNGASSYLQVNGGPQAAGHNSTQPSSSGNSGICLGGPGGGLGSLFGHFAFQEVMVINRALTPTELSGLANYAWLHYGITRTFKKRLIPVGDSITYGTGETGPTTTWPNDFISAQAGVWGQSNLGGINAASIMLINASPGWRLGTEILAEIQGTGGTLFDQGFDRQCVVIWAGTNDIDTDGASDSTVVTRLTAVITAIRANFNGSTPKIVVVNMIPRNFSAGGIGSSAKEAYRVAFNTTTRGGTFLATVGADALIDIASDPAFSSPTAWSNRTYYQGDGIHPNVAGETYIANLFAPTLNAI